MAANRTVTYTLKSNTSGVAGLEKYHQVLSNILAVQEKIKAQGEVLGDLRAQVAPAIQAAEAQAQAERAAVAAKKQAGNDYTQFLKQQTAQQEALARQATAAAKQQAAEAVAAAAKIREQQAQLTLTTRLSAQAEKEAQKAVREAMQERKELLDGLRLAYARIRAEYDKAAGYGSDEKQRVAAAQAYRKAVKDLEVGMEAYGKRADLTARELKALADMQARVARETNTIAGGINPAGLSGNVANALRGNLPQIITGLQNSVTTLSPSLGAASMGGQQLINTFGGLGTTGTVATGVIGLVATAVVGFGMAANKAADEAGKLQFEVAKVSTLTDKMPNQLGAAGREVLNISRELGMSYQDIAEGLNQAIGASVRGTEDMAQALQFTEAAGKLAVAGNTSTAESVDLLSSVMNAYKLNASDTTKVSDGLFAAIRDGKMEVSELSQSMGKVTAMSADLNIPLPMVNAALATMTANGIKTSAAVDYLRSMLSSIQKPSSEAATLADNLKLKFDAQSLSAKGLVGFLQDVIAATKGNKEQMAILFGGVEALSAATSIASGNFERMKTNLDNQAEAAGTTEKAYQKMMGTLKKENDRFDANWKSVWANLGEYMLPFKTEFMSFMNDALEKLNQFLQRANAARNATHAQEDVDKLKADLANAERDKKQALDIMKREKDRTGVVPEYWTRKLAQLDDTIVSLRGRVQTAEAALTQAKADQVGALYGPQLGPNLATGNVLQDIGIKGRTISQNFGLTTYSAANKGKLGYEDGTHHGLDVSLPVGTKLFTPSEVKVMFAGWNRQGFGNLVKLLDSEGNQILMAHLSQISDEVKKALKNGGTLAKGTLVGLSGNSGNSDGPHLHLEMRDAAGRVFNPLTYGGSASPTYQSTGATPPAPATGNQPTPVQPITAADLQKAQQLSDALEKAKKALQADPKNVGLQKAFDAADQALKGWTKDNDAHARALAAVQAGLGGAKRAAGDYVATQKDLAKYGDEALKRIKAQEEAQKSGDAEKIRVANNALKAFQDQGKAQAAVVQLEQTAYQSRKSQAQQDERDAKQRAKEQRTLAAQAAKEARQLRFDDADATLKRMQNNDKAELDSFKGSVEERLELIKRQTQAEFYAAEAVARVKRDNALRDSANQGGSNQAERDRQIKQQYTDTLTSLKAARIAAVKEGQKVVDDFWDAAIKDAERQAQGIEDHWTRMAQGAEKARDGVGELLISIEDAVNNIPDATDAQADYVRGMEMLEKAGQAAAGSVLAVKEAIEQKAATEKAAAQEASDLALLDTFGGGKAGLESLFSTFGVSGIDQLAQLDSGLAEQVKRVYKSTFALLDKELQDAIERGHTVMENAVAEFEQQSEATSVAADAAAAAINERNANTVQSLKDRGPEAFLNFLNFGKYFGAMFDRLGADGREAFMQSFDQFTPEDFSAAGEDFLSGILNKLPDDERWNALRVKLMAARDMAVAAQIEVDHLLGDIKQNPDQYGDGGRGMVSPEPPKNQFVSEAGKLFGMDKNDLANPEKVQQLRDGWAQLRADAKLTDFDLQNLNGTLDKLVGGEDLPAPLGLDGWRQSLQELIGMFDEGKITADQFRAELNNGAASLEDLAKQADAAGNPRLAQAFRELAKEAKNLDPELAKLEKRLAALQGFGKLFSGVGSLFKSFGAETLGAIADAAGQGLAAITQMPSAINDVRAAFNSFKKGPSLAGLGELAGAIGGVASIAGSVVSAIFAIGDAIENSNAKLNKWKSNLREVASLEQQRMGSQFIGGTSGINGWENPYYQQLSQDAAARNQLANSKWYQRVAWSVFGGGPQVMSDELAKTKSEAAAIFNDFGSSLYGTMENALLDAIDKGDFSNVAANIGKSIDQFVQRLYVQTLLAKSNLKTLVQQLADDQAAGRDTSQDLAKIRAEMEKVTGDAAAGAGQLAGYGAGADSGSSTSGSGAASSAITGANFYVANSSKIDLFDQSILRWDGLTARIDAMYLRHEVVLDRHSAAVGRHADMLERVLRDGITLTATSSGYAGAMR